MNENEYDQLLDRIGKTLRHVKSLPLGSLEQEMVAHNLQSMVLEYSDGDIGQFSHIMAFITGNDQWVADVFPWFTPGEKTLRQRMIEDSDKLEADLIRQKTAYVRKRKLKFMLLSKGIGFGVAIGAVIAARKGPSIIRNAIKVWGL